MPFLSFSKVKLEKRFPVAKHFVQNTVGFLRQSSHCLESLLMLECGCWSSHRTSLHGAPDEHRTAPWCPVPLRASHNKQHNTELEFDSTPRGAHLHIHRIHPCIKCTFFVPKLSIKICGTSCVEQTFVSM